MKLQDISLFESYSTAKQVFAREASPEEVGKRLDQFKALNQRNMLKPEERDLGKWIRSGWEAFSSFVADASSRTSGKSEKKAKKSDSIKVHENEGWLVVIPLSKDASCFYGRDTEWCTAATKSQNYFDQYFLNDNITLMYFLHKQSGEKLAIARHTDGYYDVFDKNDKHIKITDLSSVTGFAREQIEKWFTAAQPTTNHHRGVEEPRRRADILAAGRHRLNNLARTDPRLVVVSSDEDVKGYLFPGKVSSADIQIKVYEVDMDNGDISESNVIGFHEMIDDLHGLDSHPEALAKVIKILRDNKDMLKWLAEEAMDRMSDVADTLRERGVTSEHPHFVDMTFSKLRGNVYKALDLAFVMRHIPEFEAKIHEYIKDMQGVWDEYF